MREVLQKACEEAGGQSAWATKAGVTQQHVPNVLAKKRDPSDEIYRALGYERQVTYIKKDIWEENQK